MNARSGNQLRTFEKLVATLRPYIRSDRNLPSRIQKLLTTERRFGSRDRRLYRELLYTTIRFWPWFEELELRSVEGALQAMVWLAASTRATEVVQAELPQSLGKLPPTVAEKAEVLGVKSSLLPDWLAQECAEAGHQPNADILQTRAPLWLRLQTNQTARVFDEFIQNGWQFGQHGPLPEAVEVYGDVDVTKTQAFAAGQFEVQDIGSQVILAAVGVNQGEQWLDGCAGAGGKTLFLADRLGPNGRVVAHDIRESALRELRERSLRAGFNNIEIRTKISGQFDTVLVDAPCTGSGTWRRAPHLKWSTSINEITSAAQVQLRLLNQFSAYVRPGGRLIYATCSLAQSENVGVVAGFLSAHPEFLPGRYSDTFGLQLERGFGLTVLPASFDGDGFYVAALQRK